MRVLTPSQEMRVFLAFAVQPLVAALVALILSPLITLSTPGVVGAGASLALSAAVVAVPTACLAAAAFGWLLPRGRVKASSTIAGGAVLGNAPVVVLMALILINGSERDSVGGPLGILRALAIGAAVGSACAAVFWLMVRRHVPRPDAIGAAAEYPSTP
jgi:hypothetical protein